MAGPKSIIKLAELRIIAESAKLEAELSQKAPGWFIEIYRRLRTGAAESIAAIGFVDADDPKIIRELQLRIRMFDEFCLQVQAFINEGIVLDKQMTESERNEALDVLMMSPEGEREAISLGLVEPSSID